MRTLRCIGCVVLLACGGAAEGPDSNLLPRDTFREILLEAQLVEARMNHELTSGMVVAGVPTDGYYEELFAAHGTTAERFEATFRHYTERPEELKAIYEEILTELSRRKDETRQ